MSKENNPDYKWRMAAAGDIGSVARFGDTDHKHEPWEYGILLDIERCYQSPVGYKYTYKSGPCYEQDEALVAFVCQIQYNANKEP